MPLKEVVIEKKQNYLTYTVCKDWRTTLVEFCGEHDAVPVLNPPHGL